MGLSAGCAERLGVREQRLSDVRLAGEIPAQGEPRCPSFSALRLPLLLCPGNSGSGRAAVRGGSPAPFGSQSSVLRLLSSPEDNVGTRWLCGWSRDYFWVSEAGGVGVCWVPSAACLGVIDTWLANTEDSAGCVRVTGVDAGR